MFPAPAIVMPAPRGIAVGGKGQPPAIGRPCGAEETVRSRLVALYAGRPGQVAQLSCPQVHDPDIGTVAIARGNKGQTRAIGRQDGGVVHRWMADQGCDIGSVRTGAEYVRLSQPVPFRCKEDGLSIRGKGCMIIKAISRQERPFITPVRIGNVKL